MRTFVFAAAIAVSVLACRESRVARDHGAPLTVAPTTTAVAAQPETEVAAGEAPTLALRDGYMLGRGRTVENLTVFPVLAKTQPEVGPVTTLDAALEAKKAEVRETGAGGQSGEVNQLVIQNKGEIPIFVLAGTVVKGGRQDRQIGQDFLIGPKQTVAVDAFCVEHGRWTPEREGVGTGGTFGTLDVLANSEVRAAGQYDRNQSEVWDRVGKVNAANKKAPSSGTLTATLDDKAMAEKRARFGGELVGFVKGVVPQGDVVGIAYAVDGRVRGVRWFASHRIFDLFRDKLLGTAAVEALTARAASPEAPLAAPVAPEAVRSFLTELQTAEVKEERRTAAENVNEYKESAHGYGSTVVMKPAAAPAATTRAPAVAPRGVSFSSDFSAK